jgi:hypothetical protein
VEFGAGNDSHGSTSHRLIAGAEGYSAVLIEGVPEKYRYLCDLYGKNNKVTVFNKFVGFRDGDGDRLDLILSKTPIPRDFDFLSIDIDGNDYHVWNAITAYQPKLLMVEFNPTIPPEVQYVQPADPAVSFGSSLSALVDLGKTKGYELISVYGVNALFVRRENFARFGVRDNSVHTLWTKRDLVTYIFSGYDGRIALAGLQQLPWTYNIQFQTSRMQVLPRFLQKYRFTRGDYRLYQLLRTPRTLAAKMVNRILRRSR